MKFSVFTLAALVATSLAAPVGTYDTIHTTKESIKTTFFTADKNKAADHVLHQNVPKPIQDSVHEELPDKAEAESQQLDKQLHAEDTSTDRAVKTVGDKTKAINMKLEPVGKTIKAMNKGLNGPTKSVTDTYEETQDTVNSAKKESGVKTAQESAESKINEVKKTLPQ